MRARAAVVLLAMLVVTAGLVVTTSDRPIASAPILSVLGGEVVVRPAADAPSRAGQDGETLTTGASVQTQGPSGRAVLTFRDGSTVELEPDAAVSIDEVSLGPRGELIVRLRQTRGKSWAHVQPLLSPSSHFSIRTPSATAVVRGTSFEVEVEAVGADGEVITRVSVFDGQVDLVAAGAVRPVIATQTTEVVQHSAPRPPKQMAPPQSCLRMELTSSALMTVTDPDARSVGRTPRGTVSQTPKSMVNGPQEPTQLVDAFSPQSGDWEVGITPRGDGGTFELLVNIVGTKTGTATAVLTGSIQPGQRLVMHMRITDDGQVSVGALQPMSATRAKIVDVGYTTSAPLPQAKLFVPAVDRPSDRCMVEAR